MTRQNGRVYLSSIYLHSNDTTKTVKKSQAKDHTVYLDKRLNLWKSGDLTAIISEGCEIQNQLEE